MKYKKNVRVIKLPKISDFIATKKATNTNIGKAETINY